MRNWYVAIREDLGCDLIDLIKLQKNQFVTITAESLVTYRNEGNVPKKGDAIDGILTLINSKIPEFTKSRLQEYFDGKHAVPAIDEYKDSYTVQLSKALQAVAEEKIELETPTLFDATKADDIAQWIIEKMSQPKGYTDVGLFLEYIRRQVVNETDFSKIRELHDVIAPLVLNDTSSLTASCGTICSFKGVDNGSGAAMAGLGIRRSQGAKSPLLELVENDSDHCFKPPENAVVEDVFSAETDDLRQRVARKLLGIFGKLPPSVVANDEQLSEQHYIDLGIYGEDNLKSLELPYIYLNNKNISVEELQDKPDFKGIYTFANDADKQLDIFKRAHYLWLIGIYSKLDELGKTYDGFSQLRLQIKELSATTKNKELQTLYQTVKDLDDKGLLKQLEKALKKTSGTVDTIKLISKLTDNGFILYDKVATWLPDLVESIKEIASTGMPT